MQCYSRSIPTSLGSQRVLRKVQMFYWCSTLEKGSCPFCFSVCLLGDFVQYAENVHADGKGDIGPSSAIPRMH